MSFVCDICDKSFIHKAHLKRHLLNHGGEKSHVCNVCNKAFCRKENLKKHLLIHSGERSHVCDICNKTFSWKQSLKEHLLLHSGECPHVCNICNRAFVQKGHLKNHSLIHIGEKPHVCNVCNKAFTERGTLRRHLLTHSGERSHVCGICGKSFSRKDFLTRHSLLHSGISPQKKKKKEKVEFSILNKDRSNVCGFCEKVFDDSLCVKIHFARKKQEYAYACETCLENFAESEPFKRKSAVSFGSNQSVSADESGYEKSSSGKKIGKEEAIYIIKEEHDLYYEGNCHTVGENTAVDHEETDGDFKNERGIGYEEETDGDFKNEQGISYEEVSGDVKEKNAPLYETIETIDDLKDEFIVDSKEVTSYMVEEENDIDHLETDNDADGLTFDKEKSNREFNLIFVDVKQEPIGEN